ncbi:MAG TPA: PadR family transcriptional regulator [Verrucomicrobiae bacterium]|nr:PadR family transcriptional regulator [Verrucomicrobiae bacterium]
MQTSYGILGVLSTEPNYGYELKRLYDQYFGQKKPLAYGQVYATLARLKRDGKIVAEGHEQSGGPARTKYAITNEGQRDLERWLATPETIQSELRSTAFAKIVAAILLDKDPHRYLDIQRSSHIARMRELTKIRRHADLATALRADYEIFHLEADLRWIDLTFSRLSVLTQEIANEQNR